MTIVVEANDYVTKIKGFGDLIWTKNSVNLHLTSSKKLPVRTASSDVVSEVEVEGAAVDERLQDLEDEEDEEDVADEANERDDNWWIVNWRVRETQIENVHVWENDDESCFKKEKQTENFFHFSMFSEIKLCANVFTFKTVKRFKGFFRIRVFLRSFLVTNSEFQYLCVYFLWRNKLYKYIYKLSSLLKLVWLRGDKPFLLKGKLK